MPEPQRSIKPLLVVMALLAVGWLARVALTDGSNGQWASWLPWNGRVPITLYYGDPTGDYLVPVSQTVAGDDSPATAIVTSLLEGPASGTGLLPLVPSGTEIKSVTFQHETLSVDLSGDPSHFGEPLLLLSLHHSLTSWSEVREVEVTVGGVPIDLVATPKHLLFYWDEPRDMLVAQPIDAADPREVIEAYLAGPPTSDLTGLPTDTQLLDSRLNRRSGLLILDFSYQPSISTFALEHPDGMRRVLEGLIATMTTGFNTVDAVYLDFEGQTMLGLGQCADLLRSPQLRPEVLNDERLLSRVSS